MLLRRRPGEGAVIRLVSLPLCLHFANHDEWSWPTPLPLLPKQAVSALASEKGVTALGLKSGVKNNHGELLWQVTSRSKSGFLPSVLLPAVHPLGMDMRG